MQSDPSRWLVRRALLPAQDPQPVEAEVVAKRRVILARRHAGVGIFERRPLADRAARLHETRLEIRPAAVERARMRRVEFFFVEKNRALGMFGIAIPVARFPALPIVTDDD